MNITTPDAASSRIIVLNADELTHFSFASIWNNLSELLMNDALGLTSDNRWYEMLPWFISELKSRIA